MRGLWLTVCLLPVGASASPTVTVQLEAGLAHLVSAPQRDVFGFGEALSLRADLSVVGPLSAQVSGTFVNLAPQAAALTGPGRLVQAGVGARVRPLDWLWFDAQALLVGTGPNLRFGYELGAGAAFFVSSLVALGPYLRWQQVVDPPQTGFDDRDALLVHGGLAVSLRLPLEPTPAGKVELAQVPTPLETAGPGSEARLAATSEPVAAVDPVAAPAVEQPASADPVPTVPPAGAAKRLDSDGDGIPDTRDVCPDEPEIFNGFEDDDGCPDPRGGPAAVRVVEDRVELLQPLRFDRANRIEPSSMRWILTLARVLALHPELERVRLTVSEPSAEVARKRAASLLAALVEVGLPAERLEAEGVAGKTQLEIHALRKK